MLRTILYLGVSTIISLTILWLQQVSLVGNLGFWLLLFIFSLPAMQAGFTLAHFVLITNKPFTEILPSIQAGKDPAVISKIQKDLGIFKYVVEPMAHALAFTVASTVLFIIAAFAKTGPQTWTRALPISFAIGLLVGVISASIALLIPSATYALIVVQSKFRQGK